MGSRSWGHDIEGVYDVYRVTSTAARFVTAWAFSEGGLVSLTAEAETSNPASMWILTNAGFVRQVGADEVSEMKGSMRNFSVWRAFAEAVSP